MSLTILGNKTKTIFLKGIENHKLHHEFEVAEGEEVKVGQPVVLEDDGTVKAAAEDEKALNVIGYSIHEGGGGELVTVGMKAFAIVWAMPNDPLDAGPVAYEGMNEEDATYNSFKEPTPTTEGDVTLTDTVIGWALDKAEAADELIRVAVI